MNDFARLVFARDERDAGARIANRVTGGSVVNQSTQSQHQHQSHTLSLEQPQITRPPNWRPDAGIDLRVDDTRRIRTPNGLAVHVWRYADGINLCETSDGQTAFALSADKNAQVPSPLRNASGWYQEFGVEWASVAVAFPDVFPESNETLRRANQVVKEFRPDDYEAWTGASLTTRDSFTLRAREFFMVRNRNNWIGAGPFSTDLQVDAPDAMVGVAAQRGRDFRVDPAKLQAGSTEAYKFHPDRTVAHFLVPADEFFDAPVLERRLGSRAVVVDPTRHPSWSGPDEGSHVSGRASADGLELARVLRR